MRYFVCADFHGDAKAVNLVVNYLKDHAVDLEDSTIIVCGDAGLMYGDFVTSGMKKAMKKSGAIWVILRGNHDKRYGKYATEHFGEGWSATHWGRGPVYYQNKYPNILYAADEGYIYQIEGQKCLFIPGAWSIDGQYRIENNLPFEWDEQLSYMEMNFLLEKVLACNNIKYVFSHDCPLSYQRELTDLFLPYRVKEDKSMNKFMDSVKENIEFDKWYFGHYHGTRVMSDGKGELIWQCPQEVYF